MKSLNTKNGLALLLGGSVLLGGTTLLCGAVRHTASVRRKAPRPEAKTVMASAAGAQGADWAGYPAMPYNPNLPARPNGYSTDPAVVAAQTQAGAALRTAIQNAINAQQTSYTASPGVYRFADKGAIVNVLRVSRFTLNAAGCTFILAGGGIHLVSGYKSENDPAPGVCSDITIQGSDSQPLIIDRDLIPRTQGTITGYDPATGLLQVKIMPGYAAQIPPTGDVTAYTAQGQDIPFGYYHSVYGKYANGQTLDPAQGIVTVTTDKNDAGRYAVGGFVTLPVPNVQTSVLGNFERTVVTNLTLKDIAGDTGTALLDTWSGRLDGTTRLIRVKNGPLPGTNRLGVGSFSQTSSPRGTIIMDGCEFGGGYDDAMDIQSSGLNMFYQASKTHPNQMIVWNIYGGLSYKSGETLSVFADKNFAKVYSGTVTAVSPFSDPAALTDASTLWNSFRRRSKSGGSLALVTLDKPVTGATPGDYIENVSKRMPSFTMTNCYWHQIGVRVMIEGIQSGTFTHNTFDGVNGGLALVTDPYWAQGGTCQNVTVSNNVFRNCNLDKVQGSGALVLGPYWGSGPLLPGQAYGFQNFTVTHNTFTGPSLTALNAHIVGGLVVAHNLFSIGAGAPVRIDNCVDKKVFDNKGIAGSVTQASLPGKL